VLFAVIGILDNLIASYRSRKEEFSLFVSAGMSKNKVRKMILCEISYLIIFGIIVGFLSLLAVIFMLDGGFVTFGYPYLLSLFGA
jgi:ABC-type antimicrobial peptide transport system permease subunit